MADSEAEAWAFGCRVLHATLINSDIPDSAVLKVRKACIGIPVFKSFTDNAALFNVGKFLGNRERLAVTDELDVFLLGCCVHFRVSLG